MRHFPLRELGYAIAFVVLLTGLYVGAYYATVHPDLVAPELGEIRAGVCYRYFGELDQSETSAIFFQPIHQLDRMIRRDRWSLEGVKKWLDEEEGF